MKKAYLTKLHTAMFLLMALLTANIAKAQGTPDLFLSFTTAESESLSIYDDVKYVPISGWASSYHAGTGDEGGIENSFDNKKETFYHSNWNGNDFPVTMKYTFASTVDQIDYIVYYPRISGSNGLFKELEIYYTNRSGDRVLCGKYDFKGSTSATVVRFDAPLTNPQVVEFKILSSVSDAGKQFASCSEMEFYKINKLDVDLGRYFADKLCTTLKPGVTRQDIDASNMPQEIKKIAIDLLAGGYSPFRVQEYEAYRPIADLAKELKLSTYNAYENPTGIWFKKGDEVTVIVDQTEASLTLTLRNWTAETTANYVLSPGINKITADFDGQTYVNYYTPDYKTAKPVKMHINGGSINGYFDRNIHKAEDWAPMLQAAAGDHLDIKGNYTNLIFFIDELKKNCPEKGMTLIELYDEIIEMEYELMGFFKYTNRMPKNHMLGRNMPRGFMHADGLGAAFNNGTMVDIGNPDKIVTGDKCWGIAHEYGHVNQVRPGLKWVGTAECTNNVYSSYVQYMLTSKHATLSLRLEHEAQMEVAIGSSPIRGGRFNAYLNSAHIRGENWLFQWGGDGQSDHFVKLVPIWQLNLFFKIAKGTGWEKPDWYADICEETRATDDANFTHGQHQLNFVKRVCKYTETDLTDFFIKAGILKPVDEEIDDYGKSRITITQAMCNEVIEYVKAQGWPKPQAAIDYISGNTVKAFEQKLPVEGTKNTGVSGGGTNTFRRISHSIWKNVVAFEVYNENQLLRLAIAGTGTTDMSMTTVPFPAEATKIVAVAWDGARTTVYEK